MGTRDMARFECLIISRVMDHSPRRLGATAASIVSVRLSKARELKQCPDHLWAVPAPPSRGHCAGEEKGGR